MFESFITITKEQKMGLRNRVTVRPQQRMKNVNRSSSTGFTMAYEIHVFSTFHHIHDVR